MKIVVIEQNGTYFASTVEDNGDEFELTRGTDKEELIKEIRNMGITAEIEFVGN